MAATERDDDMPEGLARERHLEQLVSRAYAELRYRKGWWRGFIVGAFCTFALWILLDVVLR